MTRSSLHRPTRARPWSPDSWRTLAGESAHAFRYADRAGLDAAVAQLRTLPPLVTSWEVERLRVLLAEAEEGRRFILQGGDCAESFDDCRPAAITSKLKILLQMSMVLVHGLRRPVVRVGRIAGQYAKPRTSPTETRTVQGRPLTLPSYFGDLINRPAFDARSREPDPALLLDGYHKSAMTLNFVRALNDGGFADLHHPEYWDLSFLKHAAPDPALLQRYEQARDNLAGALRFVETLSERASPDLSRSEFFTSHECLNLWYESAQTRAVPRRPGIYNLTTHLPWIGERTRRLGGPHVEFCRGIANPVGVKLGPSATPEDVLELCAALNPRNEAGKLVLIARLGTARVRDTLPPMLRAVRDARARALWLCDPMHGNTRVLESGLKTRHFEDILAELMHSRDVHREEGVPLGGVHLELTGEDVTECTGGSLGTREQDLALNYATMCDPRLNYHQALEVAFLIAREFTHA